MGFKFFNYMGPVLFCIFVLVLVMGSVSAESSVDFADSGVVSLGMASDMVVNEFDGSVDDVDLSNFSYVNGSYSVNKNVVDGGISRVGASKTGTQIVASNLNMYYDTGKYVVAYLKTSSGKAISGASVKISIDGRSWTKTTDSNGRVTLKIVTLTPKVYPCTIKFAGTTSYAASSKSINVTVKRYTSVIEANNLNMVYGTGKYVVAYLKNGTKPLKDKAVKITIDGRTWEKYTDSNGKVTLKILTLTPKVYPCTIKFAGNNYYSSSSKTINVTVKGYPTYVKISPSSISMNYGDSKKLTVRLLNSSNNKSMASKTVSLVVNGKTYNKTTNSTGYAVFTIPTLNPGVYSATVKFGGGSNYASCSKTLNVTVNKIFTKISTNSSDYVFAESGELIAILQNKDGKAIGGKILTFSIDNKTFSATTDSNGRASFLVSELSLGNYSGIISFGGDNSYNASSESINLIIKSIPSISIVRNNVSFVENNLSSSEDFKIVLKDSMGIYIFNQSVNISIFDGKSYAFISDEGIVSCSNSSNGFYNLVTDEDGCISLRFNLPSGIWNISMQYLGNDIYGSCSASVIVPVFYSSIKEFDLDDVVRAAKWVKDYVNLNKELPDSVLVSDENCSIAEFSYLISSAIFNIYSNDFGSLYLDISYSCEDGSGICCEDLSLLHYSNLARNIALYMGLYFYSPSCLGGICFDCYVYTFSKILSFYQITNHLPSEINFNSNLSYKGSSIVVSRGNVSQFVDGVNEINTLDDVSKFLVNGSGSHCEITSNIRSYASILTSNLVSDWDKANAVFNFVRDDIQYVFYYNSVRNASGTLDSGKGSYCDQANLLVALFRSVGLPARYCHAMNVTFGSGTMVSHVWVQVLVDGVWYVADPTSTRNVLGNVMNWITSSIVGFTQYDLLPF